MRAFKFDNNEIDQYAAPPDSAEAFPLLKSLDQLKGLPRAAIVICGSDPLADEGFQYANKLKAAG